MFRQKNVLLNELKTVFVIIVKMALKLKLLKILFIF